MRQLSEGALNTLVSKSFIPPDEFVPLCEVSDLIHDLTDFVIAQALTDMQQLGAAELGIQVAVNISTRDLMNQALPDSIDGILQQTGAPARMLQLEITENDLMHDPDRARQTVNMLDHRGIGLAIDDFGTGYSSLAYLKHLKVQELKIDRSFVRDLLSDDNDAVIVRSTIELGRSLGLAVTAEGVEDAAVLERLKEFGCELAQGFHIAKPMPAAMLEQWLNDRNWSDSSIHAIEPNTQLHSDPD